MNNDYYCFNKEIETNQSIDSSQVCISIFTKKNNILFDKFAPQAKCAFQSQRNDNEAQLRNDHMKEREKNVMTKDATEGTKAFIPDHASHPCTK